MHDGQMGGWNAWIDDIKWGACMHGRMHGWMDRSIDACVRWSVCVCVCVCVCVDVDVGVSGCMFSNALHFVLGVVVVIKLRHDPSAIAAQGHVTRVDERRLAKHIIQGSAGGLRNGNL